MSNKEIFSKLPTGNCNLATIYRSMHLLENMRMVKRFDFGDGVARYEAADPGGDHHHHVVCDRCGQIEPFHDPGLERAIKRLAGRLSFAVDDHEVVLRGECSACRN